MANLRELKKEIDYRLEEVVFDCDMAIAFQPSKEQEIFELMQKAVALRNELIAKVSNTTEPHNKSLVRKYYAALEQLEELISQLQGAGHTTVMVTLSTGEETVYAVDTQTGDMQQQETHVLLQDGSALAETTYLPQVCGVAVLCEGGGDVRVAARITELLHSLLDLPTNRICVEQRKR